MTEDEALSRFGVVPDVADVPQIRALLEQEIAVARAGGDPDTEAMKLFCVQLFATGDPQHSLLIFEAKRSHFDAGIGIDVQLLAGAGLASTRSYLERSTTPSAATALDAITASIRSGDFDGFSPAEWLQNYRRYYGIG